MAKTPDATQAEGDDLAPELATTLTADEFELRLQQFQKIFEDIKFDAEHVKKASKVERQNGQLENTSLTYGEMDVKILHGLLNVVKRSAELAGEQHVPLYVKRGSFLDLGSGVGKASIAAALLHPFEKVYGIEIVECLHARSVEAKDTYETAEIVPDVEKPVLEFIKGDMAEEAPKIAGEIMVALAMATCFSVKELAVMKEVATLMPENSVFITCTHMLPPSVMNHSKPTDRPEGGGWWLIHEELLPMPWGDTTCFVLKKEPAPKPVDHSVDDAVAKEPEA